MKTFRIYFNRKSEYPHVWSIDEGEQTSEIIVQWIACDGVSMRTHYSVVEAIDRENIPCAWFSVEAVAEFTKGGVFLRGEK